MNKEFYVYLLSNKNQTVFYTGVTNNLIRRIYEHKQKIIEGFTKKYNINQLLYYELLSDPTNAILREKQVKDMRREKKLELIKKMNPDMKDLYSEIIV